MDPRPRSSNRSASTPRREEFKDFVLEQLDRLDGLEAKAMFGGFGLYSRRRFFGIVFKQRLYFRTDESTRGEYERRGMKRFRPSARQTLKSYYEVPAEILENRDALQRWAGQAAALAGE